MPSKLAMNYCNRLMSLGAQTRVLPRGRLRFATSSGRTADPAVHSVEPEEVGVTEAIRDEKLRHQPDNKTMKENDTYIPPKSPIESSPKLEHPAVGPPKEPITQQKRRSGTTPPSDRRADGRRQVDNQVDDNRDYFKHHKASPLSEIEFADTRKPVTRATDGGTQNSFSIGYEKDKVILWRPEQLDTAEDSLNRATKIFRQNAVEGDPDSPHGRVLRALLGRT